LRGKISAINGDQSKVLERITTLIEQHEQTLRANLADWQSWSHAIDLAERAAGLVDKQDKRLQRARWFYSWPEVQRMFRALIESVNRHEHDVKILSAIQSDWTSTMLAFYAETSEPMDIR